MKLPGELSITLSQGGQNPLIKSVIEDFCSIFAPGGSVVYIGDSGAKWAHFDEPLAERLGIPLNKHGKMPDVLVHLPEKNWLIVVEAVTSHGPVSPKRHLELKELLSTASAGLVFVSAFPDRKTLLKHLSSIAWETEVWCAEAPTHLIHFNGERFLGPYGT